jgi:hypothetical protein
MCYIFYHIHVDPEKDGTVDLVTFGAAMDVMIPDPDTAGWGIIDLEKPYNQWLAQASGPQFEQAQSEMIKALQFAKQQRPNIKWTCFGLLNIWIRVAGQFWHEAPPEAKAAAWARHTAPVELFAELDWFNPCIYDFFLNENSTPQQIEGYRAWVREKVDKAVEIAEGRPIIPAVWHRIFDFYTADPLRLIPLSEWGPDSIELPIERGACGVCWWGADIGWHWPTGALAIYCPDEFDWQNGDVLAYLNGMHAERAAFLVEHVLDSP